MKVKALAVILICWLAPSACAQVVIGVRAGDGVVYGGSSVRIAYHRGNLLIGGVAGGVYGSTNYLSITAVYPPPLYPGPVIVVPPPRIIVKVPILGPGYSQDIRGVDLDLVPLKKPVPSESTEPVPKPREVETAKPLPGVEVSKPRPPVRPGDAAAEIKAPPKELPLRPAPPLPVPPGPLADKIAEGSRLIDLGLAAFQDGDYGLAAQRFRQATGAAPKLARAWFLLAQAECAMGEYRDAVAAIHGGMKIDKQWPRTPIQLRADLYKGRDADFADHLKRLADAVAANPNHPTLLFLVAHQLWFDGQRKDALALFQRARPFANDPSYIDAFLAAGAAGQVAAN